MTVLSGSFPLLEKELVEQAARRRTYLLRSGYTLLLFLGFGVVWQQQVASSGRQSYEQALGALSVGRQLFAFVVQVQVYGIVLVLPAALAASIAGERERRSLPLLLISNLSPQKIVTEKLLGRLLPMATFVLAGFPLLAVAHALGGVSTADVLSSMVALIIIMLQVGSLAVAASAYFATTPTAFVATGVGIVLWRFVPFFGDFSPWSMPSPWSQRVFGLVPGSTVSGGLMVLVMALVPVVLFFMLACRHVVARAFVTPQAHLLKWFRQLDRDLHALNRRYGGIVLVKPIRWLPGNRPVAWQETTVRSLGRWTYQLRILILVLIPVNIFASYAHGGGIREGFMLLRGGFVVTAGLAMILVAVVAAGSVGADRARGTLDVLLTTPLAGREIVKQKMVLVSRCCGLAVVPLLNFMIYRAAYATAEVRLAPANAIFYVLATLGLLLLYLAVFGWLAMLCGLRIRQRHRSVVAATLIILLWNAPPFFFWSDMKIGTEQLFLSLCPSHALLRLDWAVLTREGQDLVPTLIGLLWGGFLLRAFRREALRHPNRDLGRA